MALEKLSELGVKFKLHDFAGVNIPMSVAYPAAFPAVTIWYHLFDSPLPNSDSHAFYLWGTPREVVKEITDALAGHGDESLRLRILMTVLV